MPQLMTADMEQLQAGSGYRFSATKPGALGAAEFTLATIVMDASGSVKDFAPQLENALKTIFKACNKADNARRDNLLLRLTQFNDDVTELHGFKELRAIKEDDYTGILNIGGLTALFDATDEAIAATTAYAKTLTALDFTCNGIVVIATDGQNNRGSILEPSRIAKSVSDALKDENLQSLLIILVGVTNDDNSLDTYLKAFKDEAGITQYVSIGKATPGKIAKLADFVSQSISSTSQALAGKTVSQPVTPPAGFNF